MPGFFPVMKNFSLQTGTHFGWLIDFFCDVSRNSRVINLRFNLDKKISPYLFFFVFSLELNAVQILSGAGFTKVY
jgi:hypothetical protein